MKDLLVGIGRIEGKLEEHDRRFDGLDDRLSAMPCRDHASRIEALDAARGVRERMTSRRWQIFAAVGTMVGAAAALGVMRLFG